MEIYDKAARCNEALLERHILRGTASAEQYYLWFALAVQFFYMIVQCILQPLLSISENCYFSGSPLSVWQRLPLTYQRVHASVIVIFL